MYILHFLTCTYVLIATWNLAYAHVIPATTITTTINAFSSTSTIAYPPAPKFTLSNYNTSAPIAKNFSTSTSISLPALPLKGNTLNNVQSLLKLITSIPDDVLLSEDSLSTFFTSLSTCLSDPIASLRSSISSTLLSNLSSLAQEIESSLSDTASKATSLVGSIATAALPAASTALQDIESKVTAALPVITTQASDIVDDVKSLAMGAGSKIHDAATEIAGAVPAVVTKAADAVGDIGDGIEDLGKVFGIDIHLPFLAVRSVSPASSLPLTVPKELQKRASISETLSQLSDISACIANTLDGNPVFEVGKCAFNLASLVVPVGRLKAVKSLVGLLGGNVRVVQRLGGVDPKGIKGSGDVDGGVDVNGGVGKQLLDLLGELSGIRNAVDACKFLIDE